ncbi:MAG TPA: hypothetical protein VGF01_03855 [Terracidiphilus sp.]
MEDKRVKKTARKLPVKATRIKWPFPRTTLEKALGIPNAIKNHNGGNPWEPEEIRKAIGVGTGGNSWFYLTAASRDYGFTLGTSSAEKIELSDLGREFEYAPNLEKENELKNRAFLNVDIFKRVLEYYKGSNLPDMKYLGNTLQKEFGLAPETHEEFARTFRENCQFLGITSGMSANDDDNSLQNKNLTPGTVTLAEPSGSSKLTAFVILPFVERDSKHPGGFFAEVLRSLITPSAKESGFAVKTANRQGSDVIQSTIVNDLIEADLVIADLTEHNPNVMFELGFRLAQDKPVVVLKALGTGPLFDVDNMLRVFEYNPNLWQTTIEKDLPNLGEFIKGAWENRASDRSYVKILRSKAKD